MWFVCLLACLLVRLFVSDGVWFGLCLCILLDIFTLYNFFLMSSLVIYCSSSSHSLSHTHLFSSLFTNIANKQNKTNKHQRQYIYIYKDTARFAILRIKNHNPRNLPGNAPHRAFRIQNQHVVRRSQHRNHHQG